MNNLAFLFYSTLEHFGIILLGITLFKLRLNKKKYLWISFFCFLIAVVSFIIRRLDLAEGTAPLAVLILILLCIKPVLGTKIKLSLMVGAFGYILFAAIQTLILLIMNYYNLISFDINSFSYSAFLLQFLTFLVIILFSLITVYFTKEGFVFKPDSKKSNLKYSNRIISIVISLSLVFLFTIYYKVESEKLLYLTYLYATVSSIAVILLFYIALKRDREEADKNQL